MTNEKKRLPLKCTLKHLEKSYKKLVIELTVAVTVVGAATVMFISPVAIAICLIVGRILEFVNPAFAQVPDIPSVFLFAEIVVVVIGLVWISYIVFVVVGVLEIYVYARIGMLDWLNSLGTYFERCVDSNKKPCELINDSLEPINMKWVKTTLFEMLITNPSVMITQMIAVFLYMTARYGIQAVICFTVIVKSIVWMQDTFPATNELNSLIVLGFIIFVTIGVMLLGVILDPAVACLATNLNVKMLDVE